MVMKVLRFRSFLLAGVAGVEVTDAVTPSIPSCAGAGGDSVNTLQGVGLLVLEGLRVKG